MQWRMCLKGKFAQMGAKIHHRARCWCRLGTRYSPDQEGLIEFSDHVLVVYCTCLTITAMADNHLTLEWAVMVTCLMVGYKIDFARLCGHFKRPLSFPSLAWFSDYVCVHDAQGVLLMLEVYIPLLVENTKNLTVFYFISYNIRLGWA